MEAKPSKSYVTGNGVVVSEFIEEKDWNNAIRSTAKTFAAGSSVVDKRIEISPEIEIEPIRSSAPEDILDYIFKNFDKAELDTLVPEILDLNRKMTSDPPTK